MRRLTFSAIILLAFVISPFGLTMAATVQPNAPFFERQVAVYSTPDKLPGYKVLKFLPNAGISVIEVESGREWGHVQRLRARGFNAGLNLKAFAALDPDDAYYSYQWHFPAIQAPEAWDVSTGEGVTVAVLDTGLATGGEDGISCIDSGTDIVNGDNDPDDGNGHGTHVSGTIGQRTNNCCINNKYIGVAGVAFGACIMPVKVLDDSGTGSFADIAEGIHYAVDNGAQVINMSLGTNARFGIKNDPIMDPALDYAEENDVTVVCAAGNDGNRKNVSYPAIYPSTIAVGATDFSNKVTRYSNKGSGLDLVAPGGDTTQDRNGDGYADGILQETRVNNNWGYYFFQGTSMASPHVAAAAALLISYCTTACTPADIGKALTSTAKDLGETGYDSNSGWGLVQLYDALTYMETAPPPPQPPTCTDADGDGVCAEDNVDCNDNDPQVYPGHNDTKGKWGRDGVDNDCNGIVDG